jgi:hypothetical protein
MASTDPRVAERVGSGPSTPKEIGLIPEGVIGLLEIE